MTEKPTEDILKDMENDDNMTQCRECGVYFQKGKGRGSLCRKCWEKQRFEFEMNYHKNIIKKGRR